MAARGMAQGWRVVRCQPRFTKASAASRAPNAGASNESGCLHMIAHMLARGEAAKAPSRHVAFGWCNPTVVSQLCTPPARFARLLCGGGLQQTRPQPHGGGRGTDQQRRGDRGQRQIGQLRKVSGGNGERRRLAVRCGGALWHRDSAVVGPSFYWCSMARDAGRLAHSATARTRRRIPLHMHELAQQVACGSGTSSVARMRDDTPPAPHMGTWAYIPRPRQNRFRCQRGCHTTGAGTRRRRRLLCRVKPQRTLGANGGRQGAPAGTPTKRQPDAKETPTRARRRYVAVVCKALQAGQELVLQEL